MLKATESEHDALELVRRVRAGQEVSAIVSTTSSDEPCPNPHSEVRSGPPERHKRSVGSEEGSADLDHPSPGAVSGQSASTNVTSGSRSPGKRRVSVHSMLSNDADSQRSAGPSALPSPTAVPGPSSSGGEGFFRAIGSTRAAAGSDNRSGYSFDTSSRRPISGWRAAFNDSCQGTAAAPSDAMPTPPLKTTKRPFQEVRAADWGVDYIRDEVFQEILESFLFWDHPTWAIFDEIAFRDGITHGGSEYCNRFLVHTIIAFAAVRRCFQPRPFRVHRVLTFSAENLRDFLFRPGRRGRETCPRGRAQTVERGIGDGNPRQHCRRGRDERLLLLRWTRGDPVRVHEAGRLSRPPDGPVQRQPGARSVCPGSPDADPRPCRAGLGAVLVPSVSPPCHVPGTAPD